MSNFSERLKEARKQLKLNQSAFGALAGVSTETQLNYEKGTRKPDSDYLAALGVAGVDLAYLFTGVRSAPATLTADEAMLLQHYQQADEEARAALRTLAARVARA